MKRLIFLIISIFIFSFLNAQDAVVSKSESYESYTGVTSDTINGATTTDGTFLIQWTDRYTLSYHIDVDTLAGGGSNSVTIQPQGSYDGTTYTNIGSAITWGASADTAYNKEVTNTYSVSTSIAAFNILGNSAGTDTIFTQADTLFVPAQTITETITIPGLDYRYIKILLTGGGASARCELQLIGIKLTPIEVPKR